jgi:hypothetical protein
MSRGRVGPGFYLTNLYHLLKTVLTVLIGVSMRKKFPTHMLIRVRHEQLRDYQALAEAYGLSLSDWVRNNLDIEVLAMKQRIAAMLEERNQPTVCRKI